MKIERRDFTKTMVGGLSMVALDWSCRSYLTGAWTSPGHEYGAVVPSGLECFGEIMKDWV